MSDKRVEIIVSMHTHSQIPEAAIYRPIFAGRALSEEVCECEGDDTGENISARNGSFCELTALYWAWRNMREGQFIGLSHYRRYFDFRGECSEVKLSKMSYLDGVSEAEVEALMEGYDVILGRELHLKMSLREHYRLSHVIEDLDVTREILAEIAPSYVATWDRVMEGNIFSPFNMFVARRELFEGYCAWLFEILFELERRGEITGRDRYQSRVFGYIAERLLNVYVAENSLRVRQMSVCFVKGPNCGRYPKAQSALKRWINDCKFARRRQKR